VYFRFLTPALLYWRHRFAVERLERETDDVISVVIRGRDLAAFPIRAGQFMFVRFWARPFWWQSHPFSISRLPDGNEIRLSIKGVGDFTASIPKLPPGTRVLIDGPHGVFTALRCRNRKVLMKSSVTIPRGRVRKAASTPRGSGAWLQTRQNAMSTCAGRLP
jgi:predicted ferric reductase